MEINTCFKPLACLTIFRTGNSCDSLNKIFDMSKKTTGYYFKLFCNHIFEIYRPEFLNRRLTEA